MELSVVRPAVYSSSAAQPQIYHKSTANSAPKSTGNDFLSLSNGIHTPSSFKEVTARTRSVAVSSRRKSSGESAMLKGRDKFQGVGLSTQFCGVGGTSYSRFITGLDTTSRKSYGNGGKHVLVAPINALPSPGGEDGGVGSSLLQSGGIDFTPLYKNWENLVNSVKGSEVLKDGLDKLKESAVSIVSRGSELSESVAANLGDVTLPSQISDTLRDELDSWEKSASTLLSQGSQLVDNIVAKSGDVSLPSQMASVRGELDDWENSVSTLLSQGSQIVEDIVAKSGEITLPSSESFQLFRQTSSSMVNSPSVEKLSQSAARLISSAGTVSSQIGSQVSHLTGDVVHLDTAALSHSAGQYLSEIGAAVGVYYHSLGPAAGPVTATALATVAGSAVAIVSSKKSPKALVFVEGEDLPLRYDPEAIAAFFKKRPMDIAVRSLKIMVECSALTVSILFDMSSGRAQENERRRAVQLVDLITRLGPTAIKIGQALSIRPDLLPVAYLEELQKLQDRVPPFSNEEAKILIFQGLGKTAEEVFSEMSEFPVAAASLGQVYKGRLRETGEVVAIKVQRPGVLERISRDLFLLRSGAYFLQAIPNLNTDLIALLDTWAVRFFDELDYIQEAKNGEQFAENMKSLANVTVPAVYMEYTSRKVLTTQWVDGEKLSESRSDDLLPLVSTALNCYLAQLLESGFLHADPHPGNLLRTPDGRLCVLDFGLMTQVTEDQRYALVDYISHLVNSDYAKVAEDLVKLGFVPPDMEDPEKTAAVVPQLTRVLGQLVQGGGARKINIQQVTDDLANMSKDYVFVLPPYFALILRAFSVLEGIGLEADPDYTIVDECYPYISKRLLTDDSPRSRAALKDFLYGGKEQLDMQRVEEIVGGFQSFREVMAPGGPGEETPQKKAKVLDPTTKEALKIIFAPEGSYIQELLLTELVRSVDALSRGAVAQLWQLIASAIRIPGLPLPLPLSVPGSWPLPVPGLFFGMTPVAKLSEEDEKSLDTVKRIWRLLEPSFIMPSPSEILEIAQDTVPLFFDLLPGVTTAGQRFSAMLLQRLTLRFADDLDGTNSVLEWNKDPTASARDIRPLRIFSILSVQKQDESTTPDRF
ncbi:unnamed protein product [Calypogeia fissa]